jgi:hypothetical protein
MAGDVAYNVNEWVPPTDIAAISGTEIRGHAKGTV